MILRFSAEADADLDAMDNAIYLQFRKHIDKIKENPPRKHLKRGVPYFKENVGQGRIVCDIKSDTIIIVRCFEHHKEYDKWLDQFK